MKRKNNKKLALLLILVLVISVGYAALASNLKINGSSNVKASSWNVYWDNVQIKDGSVPADNNNKARITDSAKTQVEFSVVLSEPGDFYEFTVDAVNNGTIDAMIAANGIVNGVYSDSNYTQTATLPKTVSYTVTYADGTTIEPKHLLAKKNGNTPTTETYKVRIEYKNDDSINPGDLNNTNDLTYYFKFSVNYVQADDTKVVRNGGSGSNQTGTVPISYIYANDYENANITSASEGSTERLSSTNDDDGVYLRYGVSNNELITPPDTCINDTPGTRAERGELCLAYGTGSFENNTTLIKEYFDIDDDEIANGSYKNGTLECTFNSEESSCNDASWFYVVAYSNGSVVAGDSGFTFFCNVDSTSEYYCNGQ